MTDAEIIELLKGKITELRAERDALLKVRNTAIAMWAEVPDYIAVKEQSEFSDAIDDYDYDYSSHN